MLVSGDNYLLSHMYHNAHSLAAQRIQTMSRCISWEGEKKEHHGHSHSWQPQRHCFVWDNWDVWFPSWLEMFSDMLMRSSFSSKVLRWRKYLNILFSLLGPLIIPYLVYVNVFLIRMFVCVCVYWAFPHFGVQSTVGRWNKWRSIRFLSVPFSLVRRGHTIW